MLTTEQRIAKHITLVIAEQKELVSGRLLSLFEAADIVIEDQTFPQSMLCYFVFRHVLGKELASVVGRFEDNKIVITTKWFLEIL